MSPQGRSPWRRRDVWIHDPLRCLLGLTEHPMHSPYAGVTSIGYEACAQHPLRFYVRMRKTPCTQMAADQGTVMHDIQTRIT